VNIAFPFGYFSDAGNPIGIRPGNQFNIWNETRFFGFLPEFTTNDNAQFRIAVSSPLAEEQNQIRLRNSSSAAIGNVSQAGQLSYELYSVATGNVWNGTEYPEDRSEFDLLGNSVGTLLDSGLVPAVHTESFNSTQSNVPNILNWTDVTEINSLFNVNAPTDYQALILRGYFIPQETGTYVFTIEGDDSVDLIIDDTLVASQYGSNGIKVLGSTTGTIDLVAGTPVTLQIRQQNTGGAEGLQVFWRRPSQSGGSTWYQYLEEIASDSFNEQAFDIAGIDVAVSGLTIFSDTDETYSALLRNVSQDGVTTQSGMILSLLASGITLENLRFQHGHDNYSVNETTGYGVVQVNASNATLSGLSFVSTSTQELYAVIIFNANQGPQVVDNVLLQSIEIGSGVTNGSYLGGIGLLAQEGGTVSNVLIQSGFILTSGVGSNSSLGLGIFGSGTNLISGVQIIGNTISHSTLGIIIAEDTTVSNLSIQFNDFDTNTTHVSDLASAFTSLRNEVLTGNNNIFGPAVGENAFVFNALVVSNTITSAQQDFINLEQLEAYSTLQAAIDDANENETIKVRSNGTFSDASLNSTNSGTVIVDVSGLTITSVNTPTLATLQNTSESSAPLLDIQASGIVITNIALARNSGIASTSGAGAVQINSSYVTISGVTFTSNNGFEFVDLNSTLPQIIFVVGMVLPLKYQKPHI